MAVYHVLINGIARPVRRGTLRLVRRINTRPVLELEIPSLDASYIPGEGDAIELRENGSPIYGGRIEHTTTAGINGGPLTAIATRIDCVDYMQLAEDVFVRTAFFGGTLKQLLQWVIADYLGIKGVTLDPAQVDGPTLPARTFTYRSNKHVSDVLTDFCALAVGYTWTINASKQLSALPPGMVSAPFDADEGDRRVIGDVHREKAAELYANRVIVLGNTSLLLYYKDILTPLTDGVRTVFPLTLLPPGDPPHLPNAGVVWTVADAGYEVAETFGLGSATWIYDPVANTITDMGNAGGSPVTSYRQFPVAAGRALWIIYDGTPLAFAMAENVPAQAPPRGVVERIVPSELSDVPSLQIIADAELTKAIHRPLTVTYDSETIGLRPGQSQRLNYPSRGVPNILYILQQIETHDLGAQNSDETPRLRHTVTALEYIAGTTAYPDQVGDLYTLWSTDRGGTIGAAPSVVSGPLPPITESHLSLSDNTINNVTSVCHGFAPKSPGAAGVFLNGATFPDYVTVKDSDLVLGSDLINNVSPTQHGFCPRSPNPGDEHQYLSGGPVPGWKFIEDDDLLIVDRTANDVTAARHGFAPKLTGNAQTYLDGTGGYSVPAGNAPIVNSSHAGLAPIGVGAVAAGSPRWFLQCAVDAGWVPIQESDVMLSDTPARNVSSSAHGFAPKSPGNATIFLNGADFPSYSPVRDRDLVITAGTINNATPQAHGFAPQLPNDATKYLDGTGIYSTPLPAAHHTTHEAGGADPVTVTEAMQSLSDVTIGNVTIARHGYTPKLPNDPTQFFNGAGGFSVPAGGGGGGGITALTGDVIASGAGSVVATIGNDKVTFAKMQNLTEGRLLGRWGPGGGDPQEIGGGVGLAFNNNLLEVSNVPETVLALSDVTTNNATTARHGFAPKLPGNTTTYLRGDGTYATPAPGTPGAHHATHEPGGSDALVFPTGILERSRTVPMGEWIDVPFNAANYGVYPAGSWTVDAGNIQRNAYTLLGKTAIYQLALSDSMIAGGPTQLNIVNPVPGAAGVAVATAVVMLNGIELAMAYCSPGSGYIWILRNNLPAFGASTGLFKFTIVMHFP